MIPESEWTKNQREFVGSTFPTPKGGVLTVVGVHGKDSKGSILFDVHCSVCNADIELHPKNFVSSKAKLTRGLVPCSCSNKFRWTEYQYKIRVKRECDKRGYLFHGWSEEYNKSKTHLDLENPKTGNRWDSTCIGKLLIGRGDPLEWVERFRKIVTIDDNIHIKKFMETGKFLTGTEFFRSDRLDNSGFKTYWKYICPSCSNDEYVENNICTGVFEGSLSGLKAGQPSCRCTKNYRWSQEQREYQINKICDEEGLSFIGWSYEGGYTDSNSKFKWVCSQGHSCETSTSCFISIGSRCAYCARGICGYYGYYPERKDEKDYLYILKFNGEYIKVGRSFELNRRLKDLSRESGIPKGEIKILQIMTGTHKEVYDTEQWLHEELTERGFYHHESSWTVETFTIDCESVLKYLLDKSDLIDINPPNSSIQS